MAYINIAGDETIEDLCTKLGVAYYEYVRIRNHKSKHSSCSRRGRKSYTHHSMKAEKYRNHLFDLMYAISEIEGTDFKTYKEFKDRYKNI